MIIWHNCATGASRRFRRKESMKKLVIYINSNENNGKEFLGNEPEIIGKKLFLWLTWNGMDPMCDGETLDAESIALSFREDGLAEVYLNWDQTYEKWAITDNRIEDLESRTKLYHTWQEAQVKFVQLAMGFIA